MYKVVRIPGAILHFTMASRYRHVFTNALAERLAPRCRDLSLINCGRWKKISSVLMETSRVVRRERGGKEDNEVVVGSNEEGEE